MNPSVTHQTKQNMTLTITHTQMTAHACDGVLYIDVMDHEIFDEDKESK